MDRPRNAKVTGRDLNALGARREEAAHGPRWWGCLILPLVLGGVLVAIVLRLLFGVSHFMRSDTDWEGSPAIDNDPRRDYRTPSTR